jgi:membrane dipeptidase
LSALRRPALSAPLAIACRPMKRLLLVLFAAAVLGAAAPPEDLKTRAARIHASAIVVDTHEDVPYRLEKEWIDLSHRNSTGHVDVPRLKEGGV